MSNEIKLQLTGDRLVVEERTGNLPDLPPIPARSPVRLSGVLSAPRQFLSYRLPIIDGQLAIVSVSRKDLTIVAATNPNISVENDEVIGKIELNPDLLKFKINQVGANFSRETLVGFLRTNRQYFPDKEAHGQLLSTVKNLQIKVAISSGRNEDSRGNKNNTLDKTVTAENVPVSTLIEIPIFVGEKPIRLALDICYDTSEQNVFFWFESPELNEAIYDASNSRIQQEIDAIEEMGFLVIEK